MNFTWMFLFILAIIFIMFVLWNFPWLTTYYKPNISTFKIEGDKKVLIVSDLHLNPSNIEYKPLEKIVKKENVKYLVIAGDFIEYKRKEIKEEKLVKILEKILKKLDINQEGLTIFYVPSKSSHDPKINKNIEFQPNSIKIHVIDGILRLVSKNTTLYITHGDYVSRDGSVAATINRILKLLGVDLFLEKLLRKILKIEENSWLIMGHTHIPGIDESSRVANCGAWGRHILRKESNTAILVDGKSIKMLCAENNGQNK
ncbi:MAG: metallophosphoesterase family protein [Candidatus Baldrarchaeia archaeon]